MTAAGTRHPSDSKQRDAELADALEEANLPTLLAVLTHLTGDLSLLAGQYRPRPRRGPGDHDSGGLPEDTAGRLRRYALEVLSAYREGRLPKSAAPSGEQIVEILGATLGEPIPADGAGMLAEELGVVDRRVPVPHAPPGDGPEVVIIGTGFSGLCAAIRLGEAGVRYTILEKNDGVGGTWFENVYPGCGVDTPVHLYSFAFAQRPDWPRYFAKQAEVATYLEEIADRYGVREHVQFGTEVTDAVWDDAAQHWRVAVRRADGTTDALTAPIVISAVGLMSRPSYPRIPGISTFAGPAMHTAAWDPAVDLAGKRVAVIGTGASAMQLVPAIADMAAHVTVFQRSPQWIVPNPNTNRMVSDRKKYLMAEVPWYQGWYRLRQAWNFGDRLHPLLRIDPTWPHPDRSINEDNERHRVFLTGYIEQQLAGRPDLIAKCVPTYPPYGKRPLLDHGWFDTIRRDHVDLVDADVAEIRPGGAVTATGAEYEADVLVLATGFQTLNMLGPMNIRGRSGGSLRAAWGEDDARAHLGMTVPDFPNFFILFGPNTNAGHGGSHVLSVEMQVRYVMQVLGRMRAEGLTSIEVRRDVFDEYNRSIDDALAATIWTHPGMTTYYRNAKGRIVTNIPWTNATYWNRTRTPDPDDFIARNGAIR